VSFEETANALAQGFARALNLELEPSGLSAGELAEAERVAETKVPIL
jgi:hypothetical protein